MPDVTAALATLTAAGWQVVAPTKYIGGSVIYVAGVGAVVGDGSGTLPNVTNPLFAAINNVNNYTQGYIWNKNAGVNASADWITYADNSTDAAGWSDLGFTSSVFSQAAYGVTVANEGYFFVSAPTASGNTGNMVLATDSTGTANKIQMATGGFTTKANVRCEVDATGLAVVAAGAGLKVKEGLNCKQGTAVLVAGVAVVSNTAVTASSRIMLTSQVDGGTPGFVRVSTRTAGTSFTITSSSVVDISTVGYHIFEPG